MSHPARFRIAALVGTLMRPLRGLLPSRLAAILELLPPALPAAIPLPEIVPAEGERRARVTLLTGCAQSVLAPGINRAAVRVLARNGVEVVIPRGQGCCGAIVGQLWGGCGGSWGGCGADVRRKWHDFRAVARQTR